MTVLVWCGATLYCGELQQSFELEHGLAYMHGLVDVDLSFTSPSVFENLCSLLKLKYHAFRHSLLSSIVNWLIA